MRKLIVSEFVTLDGVMEAPGGEEGHPHSGWVFDFVSQEQERYKLDEVMEADALLLGRVTYEGFAGAWPERGGPVRGQDERHGEVRGLDDARGPGVGQHDRDARRAGGRRAEGAGRRADPGRRQPDARARPDGARARGRVPADDLPGRARQRGPAVPRDAGQDPAQARGHADVRLGRGGADYDTAGSPA